VSVRRLKRAVRRLERRTGGCAACGGNGRLAIVLEGEPEPPACPRCGRLRLLRLVGTTEEEFRAEQVNGKTGSAA
jgi:hypothetical protein